MSLNRTLFQVAAFVPNCLAVGVVDLPSGNVLAQHAREPSVEDDLRLMARAAVELFRTGEVEMLESLFRETRGQTAGEDSFQESLILSENFAHLFLRSKTNRDQALILLAAKETSLGQLLAAAREGLASVERAF